MWAVRRATNPLRGYGYSILACRSFSVCGGAFRNGNMQCFRSGERSHVKVVYEPVPERLSDCFMYTKFILGGRYLSSQAGPNAGGNEDQLEDGFSELESPENPDETETDSGDDAKELSGPELSEDEDSAVNLVEKDAEIDLSEDGVGLSDEVKESKKRTISPLVQLIIRSPAQSVKDVIDRWVEGGNTVNEDIVLTVMTNLRRRRLYPKALQFAEWLETKNAITLRERDYAARVDLIAKVHGIDAAESYVKKIPSMQNEVLYRPLLAYSVYINNIKKSEQLFNWMRDKGLPLTAFSCNQLLLLYQRHDKKKLADVLLMMEKENVKPTLFTYKILIDAKGQTGDYEGMEQVVENMKSEGIVPDLRVQSIIARYYVNGKSKEKAEAILKEMEGENLKTNRAACKELLPIYASLGKIDDVNRVWKLCEPSPRIEECIAAIDAWGKLGKIKNAEEVFDKMAKSGVKLPQRFYTSLLNVYAVHKQLAKGKDLVKQMADGCLIGPLTWDAIVKLYVLSGEVEKADSVLHKAVQQSRLKPFYSSYMTIMGKYAEKGDIHNAEKIFERVRQVGYSRKRSLYHRLLQTYLKAKTPAYGIRERLKADNVFPDKTMEHLLSQVDWFKKSVVSELLE